MKLLLRLHLAALVIVCGISAAGLLVVSAEKWDGPMRLAGETYARAMDVHGALAVAFMLVPLFLANLCVTLVTRERPPSLPLAYAALVTWAVAMVLTVLFGTLGLRVMAGALGLTAVHLVVVLARRPAAESLDRLAVAGIAACLVWGAVELALGSGGGLLAGMLGAMAFALPSLVARVTDRWLTPEWLCVAAIILMLAGSVGTPSKEAILGGLVGAWLLCGLLLYNALHSRARWRAPLLALIVGVVPSLAIYGATRALLSALSIDIHLHDTTFAVGSPHFLTSAIVMTVLLAVLEERHGRAGVLLLAAGLTGGNVAMLVHGMHRIIVVAAVVAVIGAVVTVATIRRRSAAAS